MMGAFHHYFPLGRRQPRPLKLEQMRLIQLVAEQVVMAVEQTLRTGGPRKKQLALQVVADILRDQKVSAPSLLIETAIEASVRVMNLSQREEAS